jgi:adenylate kinase
MPFVIVVGVQASGKTTVLKEIGKGVKIMNTGDIMMDFALKRGYVKHRDELRYLDANHRDVYKKMQAGAFADAGKKKGNIAIDTHATVKAAKRHIPGLPYNCIKLLKDIRGFVYIDSNTKDILKRRSVDKSRKREDDSPTEIETDKSIAISITSYYASVLNTPLYIIENKDGHLKEAVSELRTALSELFKK